MKLTITGVAAFALGIAAGWWMREFCAVPITDQFGGVLVDGGIGRITWILPALLAAIGGFLLLSLVIPRRPKLPTISSDQPQPNPPELPLSDDRFRPPGARRF